MAADARHESATPVSRDRAQHCDVAVSASNERDQRDGPGSPCLIEHWFDSLADAKAAIEDGRVDYNRVRPHSSLRGAAPEQFAKITRELTG